MPTGSCRPRANGVLPCEVGGRSGACSGVGGPRGQLGPIPTDERILEIVEVSRCRILHQRNRQPANQTFGTPVEPGLSSELRLDAGEHAPCADSACYRSLANSAILLFPYHPQPVLLGLPLDRSTAGQRAERA